MVEWNINHTIAKLEIERCLKRRDFEVLIEFFNGLDEPFKKEFKLACRECGDDAYDFADLISAYYATNPGAILAPNHYRRVVNWLFEKMWYCDIATVNQSLVIARLLDLMLYYRMIEDGKESSPDYIRQRVSIFDPLLTNLIKYRLYDDAWKIAASCYFQTASNDGTEFIAWQKTFLHHLARIGKYRGYYGFKLTREARDLALDEVGWLSPNRRAIELWWKKSQ